MNHYIREQNGEFLHILESKGWFYSQSPYPSRIPDDISNACTDRELYASNLLIKVFSPDGSYELTPEKIANFVDDIAIKANSFGVSEVKCIEVVDGEDLLCLSRTEIIDYILSKNISLKISFNGKFQFSKNNWFENYALNKNIHFRFNLNGHTKTLHEQTGDEDSFDKIINNINYLKLKDANFSVKTAIDKSNISYLKEILTSFKDDLDISKWTYEISDQSVSHLEIIKILTNKDFSNFWEMMRNSPLCQMLSAVYVQSKRKFLRTYPFMNFTGNIYIHDHLIAEELKVGDSSNFDLDKFLNLLDFFELDRPSCKGCFNRQYCLLGNFKEAYENDKSLNSNFSECGVLKDMTLYLMSLKENGIRILDVMLNGEVYGI